MKTCLTKYYKSLSNVLRNVLIFLYSYKLHCFRILHREFSRTDGMALQ